jgi:anti-sigma regulatory factor (Ser/Thr protein kinase)
VLARSIAHADVAPRLGPRASELAGDVALVLSELVTNAVSAGSTSVGIAVQLSSGQLKIEVTDDGIGWPQSRPPSETAVDGRGLMIVAALADRWGAKALPGARRCGPRSPCLPRTSSSGRGGGARAWPARDGAAAV